MFPWLREFGIAFAKPISKFLHVRDNLYLRPQNHGNYTAYH